MGILQHNIRPYLWAAGVWVVILIGMFFRIHNGDYFPIYQNDDGLFYVWLGNSVMDDFMRPSTLTIFDTGNENLFWRSQYKDLIPAERFGFRLTEKFFDQPFLLTVPMAWPARFFGFTGFSQMPHLLVRAPAFMAALLTLVLTYFLGQRLFGVKTGFLALTALAFWPLAVFSQRQAYLENMITPMLLLGLWAIVKTGKSTWRPGFWLAAGCAALASWTKLAGYSLFALFAYLFKQTGQEKWSKLMLLIGGVTLGIYLAYGQLVGGSHFWQTLILQGGRGTYLTSMFKFLSSPQVQGGLEDGWWYLGLIGIIYAATRKAFNYQAAGFSAVTWLLTAFFLSGEENTSPWYIYPIYPLMMLGLAAAIKDGVKNWPLVLEMLLLMLAWTGYRLAGVEIPSLYLRMIIIGWAGVNGLLLYFPSRLNSELSHRLIVTIILMAGWVGNYWAIRQVPQRVCGDYGCPEPTKIILPIN